MPTPGASASFLPARPGVACALAMAVAGCASVAGLTTLDDPACRAQAAAAIADVLRAQRETVDVDELASRTVAALPGLGPRPFAVMARSGTDFSFFVQRTDDACLLRLYARENGFSSYVNDFTYIETRPLPACGCAERDRATRPPGAGATPSR